MLRQRIREGDRYHVFHGRQMRRIGKNESHIRLIDNTLRIQWKQFRDIERRFLVSTNGNPNGDVEDARSGDSGSGYEDVEKDRNRNSYGYDEKGTRNRPRMRRRDTHVNNWMGMREAGLSIDRCTYYNTGLRHRILWWWKQDDISAIASRVQRLQIRRIERDVYEDNALIKRGLAILGGMGGEDVFGDCGEGGPGQGPRGSGDGFGFEYGGGGGGRRRRRTRGKSSRAPSFSMNGRSRNGSREGVREMYEREIRRVRRRDSSPESRSASPSDAPTARVAGSTVSMSRRGESVRRSRAPSVEYEVVNPGRIWVDVEEPPRPPSNVGRDSNVSRRMSRPAPAYSPSYVRERGEDRSPSRSRRG